MGSGFIVAILIARTYGPDGLGYLTTGQSLVVIVVGFSSLGLSGVLVRVFVERPEKTRTLIATITVAKVATGAVLLGGLVLALVLLESDATLVNVVLVMGLGYLLTALDPFDSLYNAQERFGRLVALRLGALATSTGLKVWAITSGAPLTIVAAAYGLDYALMYIAPAADLILRKSGSLGSRYREAVFSFSELRTLLGRSWPVLVSGGFAQINLKIDAVVIAVLLSVSDVGLYSAAARLSEAWSVLAMAVVTAAFPSLVKRARKPGLEYGRELARLTRGLIWMAALGAVVVAWASGLIVALVYGNGFEQSADVLAIHIVGGVFLFVRTIVSRWLIIEDLLKLSLVSHGFGAIANIALNFALIPVLGIQGAAVASVISYASSGLLFLLITKRSRPMFWMILWSALPRRIAESRTDHAAERMKSMREVS